MSRQWVRLWTDLPHSSKIQSLPDHLFKFVINCWCLTGASDDDQLPPIEELCFELRIDPGICQAYLDHLLTKNVLTRRQGSGKIAPYHWDTRQFLSDSSTDRVRKHRQTKEICKMERFSNGDVTPSDSDTDSDTDQTHITARAKTTRLPKGYAFDEQYKTFREACAAFGMAVIESDFTGPAWHEWCALDPEQRQAAIAGVAARTEAGADPQMVPRPYKYLVNREWKRAVNGARRQETAIERAIREA